MNARLISFDTHSDERGHLSFGEFSNNLPFLVKRVYYIYDVPSKYRRGYHAHLKLEQVCFCPIGSCKMLLDDGTFKKEVVLDKPDSALYIGPGVWREMYDFEPNTVLMVLASDVYDESDYIRSYEDFKEVVG